MPRSYRYYDLVMAAFVCVLLCSNLIGAAKGTWNIHKGFSQFNRSTRMVIHELRERLRHLSADLVFLQEVQGQHHGHACAMPTGRCEPQYEFLADECGRPPPMAATRCTTTATTATPSCRAIRSRRPTTSRRVRTTASNSAACCIA
jgi:endonuclease/exonuclease/phosphatase family metal-dependent hydrolase